MALLLKAGGLFQISDSTSSQAASMPIQKTSRPDTLTPLQHNNDGVIATKSLSGLQHSIVQVFSPAWCMDRKSLDR